MLLNVALRYYREVQRFSNRHGFTQSLWTSWNPHDQFVNEVYQIWVKIFPFIIVVTTPVNELSLPNYLPISWKNIV